MKGKQGPPLLHEKFKGCGYRMTRGREAVMNVLADGKDHVSAEDIYMKVHSTYPAIVLTSVYRTLVVLVNMGLVYQVNFGDGRARYELAEGPKGERYHHHLVCTGCCRVIDYADFINEELSLLKKAEEGLSKKYRFAIINHLIQFYGLCHQCQNKNDKK